MTTDTIGTPLSGTATRLLLLGSGELGREVALEAIRLGLEVIAVDRYANAPAMQVAQRSHVIDMLDSVKLRELITAENPDFVVPEVEAIATEVLVDLEREGLRVVPIATATRLTMDREGIRTMAAEQLKLPTSKYIFAGTEQECISAIEEIGMPCFVKPVMSSSGKGQMMVQSEKDKSLAWHVAVSGGRGKQAKVIVEGMIDFDYEVTLLTVRHAGGIEFCAPIGHMQIEGDYRESWQPQVMSQLAFDKSKEIASAVVGALGGWGVFGVELFVLGDEVWFSEVSPRPHDTGMVTMISQDLSQFALHVRALLGVEIASITSRGPSASCAILGHGTGSTIDYTGLTDALSGEQVDIRIFGKPEVVRERRLGVALARSDSIEAARQKARDSAAKIIISIR
jgi:phosphoribosylglycinamide formyltransferase 2